MNLKILLVNQRQVEWSKRLNEKFLNSYQEKEIVLMTEKIRLFEKDKKTLQKLNIKISPYKNFGIEDSVRQNLSIIPVNIIKLFIEKISQQEKIKKIINYAGINLISVMANDMYVLYYWPFLLFIERLKYFISQNKSSEILIFGHRSRQFICPERPDINYLFDNEFIYTSLTKEVCQKLNIPLVVISKPIFFFSFLKVKARYFIFTLIKFLKIFWRHILARLPIYKKPNIEKDNKKNIGVIIRADAEYYAIKSVLEKIKKDESELQTIILQSDMFLRPQSWKILRCHQEEFLSLYSLTSIGKFIKLFFQGLALQKKFKKALKYFEDDVNKPGISNNESISAEILNKDYIIKEIFRSVANAWPETIVFIDELKKFVIKKKPKALVSMGMIDHWVAVTSLFSQQYSIPTIAVQTATIPTHALPSPIYADKFLVYGNEIKKALINLKKDANKIIVTGSPAWDRYIQFKNENEHKTRVKKEMSIPAEARILLVALDAIGSSDATKQNNELIDLTFKFLSSHHEIYGIFKLHPRDPFRKTEYAFWQKIIQEKNIKAQFIRDINILDLIPIAFVFLSRFSFTILSSLIAGVLPIALLDLEAFSWATNIDYLRTKATTKVNSGKELKEILERAFYQPSFQENFMKERKSFLEKSMGIVDGQATERVIQVIKSLILK